MPVMNPVEYTHKLRRIATIYWLGALMLCLALAWLGILPFNEILPFIALALGSIPIIHFVRHHYARCNICGGRMKISSGHPRIVFRCEKCRAEVDTGIYSDY